MGVPGGTAGGVPASGRAKGDGCGSSAASKDARRAIQSAAAVAGPLTTVFRDNLPYP